MSSLAKLSLPAALLAGLSVFAVAQTVAQAATQNDAGQVSFSNSGTNAAQPAFLHGLAELHDFEYDIAAKDFRKAEAIDPNFAMAYWGEAMTFNHPIWMQQDRAAALAVLQPLGPTSAARLAKAPTEREKDYLRAVEILYAGGPKKDRDLRYADAMQQIHAQYPGDVDAAAFYALSLLGTAEGVRDERIYMQAAAILIPLFYKYPHHPGVAHYLIHSCDDPIHAPLALPAALAYSKIAPNAAHAQHMTSHIFLALGMWNRVVRANQVATRVVNTQRAAAGKPPAHCGHYNYWLEYGYLEQDQIDSAKSVLTACRAQAQEALHDGTSDLAIDPDGSKVGSSIRMQVRYLVDTADWSGDVAHWTFDLKNAPMPRYDQTFGIGFAAAERGDLATARQSLAAMDALLPALPALFDKAGSAPNDPGRHGPQTQRDELEAVLLAREGHGEQAIALARKAADEAQSLSYAFGPPYPEKPAIELLGDLLLEQKQPELALSAFQQDLLRNPNRTQAVADLKRAQAASGIAPARSLP